MATTKCRWISLNKIISKTTQYENVSENDNFAGDRFFNRDISWLSFNDRVLAESENPNVPLLERLFFVGIVSSNLDEFFTVRVSELLRLLKISPKKQYPDALTPEALALHVREHVLQQKSRQAKSFNLLLKELANNGIQILTSFENEDEALDKEIEKHLPEIDICFSKIGTPIPALYGSDVHIFTHFLDEYAVIRLKKRNDRILELPSNNGSRKFVLLERWLMFKAQKLFKNKQILGTFAFRLLRNADIPIYNVEENERDLERKVVNAVNKRSSSRVVRLEIDSPKYPDSALLLATSLRLDSASIYRFDLPLSLRFLTSFKQLFTKTHKNLLYPPVNPVVPLIVKKNPDIFSVIRNQDIILHHPYDSFDIVIDFLEQASKDPAVTEIFHTLYRTNDIESPIIKILKKAAKNGKKVIVYVELKARFDEMNNVMHAKDLRKAGVKVITPIGKYKVHSKLTLITRTENEKAVRYAHLGTGNYHAGTAKQYTDLGLLTAHEGIAADALKYCEMLQTRDVKQKFNHLLVSPVNLHNKIIYMIENEIKNKESGKKAHIIAKMNALSDIKVIEALYKASKAGVKIDLIVRGTCCLKPNAAGLSENIKVTSIIDRFLEHSRIFYFHSNGEKKIYLSSADWRPRNFVRRYEIAFPILDSNIKQYITDTILYNSLKDNVKATILQPNGSYRQVSTFKNAVPYARSLCLKI
ncbi:MAG: polyphosphate kinase 1 [Endomicrobia bacterium]|nr:polyphosphate kinase 1 [Endomicrobiia bacterium]MCL2506152.1 polyphosphate kinase 1 [Endomicrobiia bacterium]